MSVQPTNKMKKRLNIVIMPLLLVLVGWILINLTGAALIDSKKYEAMANQQQFGSIPIHANRGTIYDVNGKTLASSNTVYNIIFDPATFRKNDEDKLDLIKKEMKELFDIPEETMQEKSEIKGSGEGYQVIKKKVDKPQADALTKFCNENDINCLYSVQDTRRYYPQNELAANVIGFLDSDGAGQYGLEAYYDDYLAGVDGRIISAKTANGEEMPYRYQKTFDAQDGNSLYLTIDSTLQHYLEKNLSEAVTTYNVENRASGIIMNAKTGAILAMSTEPGFDLNNPAEIFDPRVNEKLGLLTPEEYKKAYPQAREQQWKNKAVTEIYYPGSVFKVVTGSAALEEKVIDTNTKFACMNMNVFGTSFHCWTKNGHGQQNFVEAMTNSCNPAFIQIGEKLGKENFTKYFEAFGLTEKTGIDLPGEVSSLYVPLERMGPVELASSSFGQTNKITPIQMITAYAATINGGYLVTPYITSKITDNNGNVIKSNETEIKRQVISEETSAIMRSTLESVVNVKGESNANIKGYRIGGKSGTSEKQDENIQQKRDDLYVSSYVGFTPADNPEIIMLVMVDTPTGGEYYGSVIAAPVVRNVFTEALKYLGYYPEYTSEELSQIDITVQSVEGLDIATAKSRLEAADLTCEVIGNGTNVVGQLPARGSSIPRGGKIILYTEDNYEEEFVAVPNLYGKDLNQANQLLAQKGLNLKTSGPAKRDGALVSSQNYAEGANVSKGTIIEVTFSIKDQY